MQRALPRGPLRIGYQDDYYVVGKARAIVDGWEKMERILLADGHRLRRTKCSAWAPAWDDAEQSGLPGSLQELYAKVPRCEGGMKLLGASCQSELETALGPFAIGCEPAKKRAAEAEKVLEEVLRFGRS